MLFALQQYLRTAAAQHRTVVRSGPFLVHVDAHSDQPYANYAIPDAGAEPSAADVARLNDAFAAHGRRPAFEFLPACAPAVRPALARAGFEVTAEFPLMTASAERLVALTPPDGLSIALAAGDVGDAVAREIRAVQNAAFGMPDAPVSDDDLARLRTWAADGVAAYAVELPAGGAAAGGAIGVAAAGGAPGAVVGAGVALPARDGFSELAGIAVAEHARGRGVAGALTATIAAAALDRGARTPFLTPGGDQAGRAYARAGFATAAETVHMALPG